MYINVIHLMQKENKNEIISYYIIYDLNNMIFDVVKVNKK